MRTNSKPKGLPYNFKLIGKKVYHFNELDSTNEYAKKIAEPGTVIIADKQTKGKGRLERNWFSPLGGIYISIILKQETPVITLIVGLSVCKTIRRYGLDARTKWPNDILVKGKKIAGILTEQGQAYTIVGIGINANIDVDCLPEEFRDCSTTLRQELKRDISKGELIEVLLGKIEADYNVMREGRGSELLEQWRSLSAVMGKTIEVKTPGKSTKGEVVDIDEDGALLLRVKNGNIEKIIAGECI